MRFSIRFIVDAPQTAAFNMAADLFLMERCAGTDSTVVTVRFYSWQPAAITLGCMQRVTDQLDTDALARDGIDWVRRPTGGRAVLHADDLTYSCVFPRSLPELGNSVPATYRIITRCLVIGLSTAGIESSLQESASPLIKNSRNVRLPCFLAPNRNEIMVQGRKLVGSAQYRTATAVLQHGSLPLTTAYSRLPRYLRLSGDERKRQEKLLQEKCIAIGEIAPDLSINRLITVLIDGFSKGLGCSGKPWAWDDAERASIESMSHREPFRRRYLSDDSTEARP
jgi:lipoate-protein ligase A